MIAHLNIHSSFSLGQGCASPEEICRTAVDHGCDTIALTDTNNLYGLIVFLQYAREYGLRPIVGAEVSSRDGSERATLLVRDREGYANLCRVITAHHIGESFDLAGELAAHSDGLVILTDSIPLVRHLKPITQFIYAELSPGAQVIELLHAVRELGVELVATARSFWIRPEDDELHKLLRAIQRNSTLGNLKPSDYLTHAGFPSEVEFRELFSYCPEAIENTVKVVDLCRWTPDFGIVYPGVYEGDPRPAIQILRDLAYEGALNRYGEITELVRDRLEHELELIKFKGFAPVFLVVKNIIEQSSLTCGRGSAAASIVSYCLGITHVEPIRHKLFFERFINTARQDPPDIDIDFAWDERDGVFDYVFKHFGETRAAMVSNHVYFKRRMAIRETAKVFGLPAVEINEITKKLGYEYSLTGKPIAEHPGLEGHGFADPWGKILELAGRLSGIPRHLSVHCGGVVITPEETSRWVPTEMATKGVRVIQWEKDQTEDSGLVKIDLLGNRSLAVIRDAMIAVREHCGIDLNYRDLNPLDDPKTQDLISRGDTFGVFYVESPATRLLARKAGKGDYEHLVIHSSIIRPAANRFINDYLKRIHGEPWQSLHPLIGDILDDNYGIMCYQEDVTRVAMSLAGFEIAKADELRKILSKKHKHRQLADLKREFYAGAVDRGVEVETIDQIWEMILSFSGYSFCKPHSASYALVSFKSAYLRAHHPAEFMAAVISNGGGYYSTMAYVSESKRMGLKMLPPDVNESQIHYVGRDKEIRVGLMQIKGLSDDAKKNIIASRADHLFRGLDDLIRRTDLKPSDARLLVLAGACDKVEPMLTRPEMMWHIATRNQPRQNSNQAELFLTAPPKPPHVPEYSQKILLQMEMETLGFLISCHPLELYQDQISPRRVTNADKMNEHVGQQVQMVGWMVTYKAVVTNVRTVGWEVIGAEDESKPQEMMEFVTFEDLTGLIETVIFPKVYQRFGHLLTTARPLRLFGKVEEDFGVATLTVSRIQQL